MIRNTFKISNTVKHDGNAVAVLFGEVFVIQFHQISSQFIFITITFASIFSTFYACSSSYF